VDLNLRLTDIEQKATSFYLRRSQGRYPVSADHVVSRLKGERSSMEDFISFSGSFLERRKLELAEGTWTREEIFLNTYVKRYAKRIDFDELNYQWIANFEKWLKEKDKTLPTRKVDKENTPTILIMQRLHENDPTGKLHSFLLGIEASYNG